MKNASIKRFRCRFFAITESPGKKSATTRKNRGATFTVRVRAGLNSLSPLKSTDTGNSRRDPRGSRTQVFYRERGILNEREFIEKICERRGPNNVISGTVQRTRPAHSIGILARLWRLLPLVSFFSPSPILSRWPICLPIYFLPTVFPFSHIFPFIRR